ncbi:MAG: bifunctional 2-C-methyl-D-erythritol 4-phosphate cytidylyltransferase/2-C-methyl-D-erythritol 2,4-cyclodiphosphate synthase [Paracoccaceae bacterium]
MRTAAIIVAAGRGTRAGSGEAKQWRPLAGRPVLAHTIDAFAGLDRTVVALHPEDMARGIALTGGSAILVAGGRTRAESVMRALEAIEGSGITHVLIHDAARPFVSRAVIGRVIDALASSPGAAPGLPVADALWRGDGGRVTGLADRTGFWRAQTPQGFALDAILAAHRAHPGGAADDVEVALAAGVPVTVVPGDEANFKITYPDDFARAERMMGGGATMISDVRTGSGFDVHAFTEGDHVTLCGVRVPHDRALLGHSDADAGMHALTDAIYGALGEGDIGQHFPPSDPRWKGAESAIFLAHAAGLAAGRGYRVTSADVTLICEAPRIGPHVAAMRTELARLLGIAPDRIGIKATTSEGLGFTGRKEGIAAIATATLVSP